MDYLINNEKLITEWDWEKNNELGLSPNRLTLGSNKKAAWVCKEGHKWVATINNRALKSSGCPYCSGRLPIMGETDLATINPKLATEWHPIKNGALTPSDVTIMSSKKVWWKCSRCNCEWQATIYSRRLSSCPECAKKNGATKRSVPKQGQSCGEKYPELVKEWHPIKNHKLTIYDVSSSSGKKVWWKCERGHEWKAAVYTRTSGSGCPHCIKELHTSFPEQAIFFYCNKIAEAINRDTSFGKEIDIYIPQHRIAIEYNGKYWHKNRKLSDDNKISFFKAIGLRTITIIESNIDEVDGDIIYYKYQKSLTWCIIQLFNLIGIEYEDVDVERDMCKIYSQYILLQKENSLGTLYPRIAEEWHPTKNMDLSPYLITAKSSKKVWWVCKKCGHEWQSIVANRTKHNNGCPNCKLNKMEKNIYCPELNSVFKSAKNIEGQYKHVICCCRGKRKSAGKHPITGEPLHWHYLYDQTRKDGTIIPGAITLGLITEEEALAQLTQQND
jgi:hypothetical protein